MFVQLNAHLEFPNFLLFIVKFRISRYQLLSAKSDADNCLEMHCFSKYNCSYSVSVALRAKKIARQVMPQVRSKRHLFTKHSR